jgi:hypothetical protein
MEVSQRLLDRITWLGTADPSWTREDGRPTTQWAVRQARALLRATAELCAGQMPEPEITATVRGGIEFTWERGPEEELAIVLPAEEGSPIEVSWFRRKANSIRIVSERNVATTKEAAIETALYW